jgi:RimJ/RimL family protein N-acetyltransferase
LDLFAFDAGEYQADLARVSQGGIEIRTLWDDEINPYMRGLYKVDVETFRDVPFRSADATDPSFDVWRLEYTEASSHKTLAIAFDGDEVVGFSSIWMPQVEGQSAGIGYTGVLREYRGRGIALAVKVVSTAEAAEAGAKKLMTGNDPDNPAVLHLNQKMGFRPVPGRVIFKKSLTQ